MIAWRSTGCIVSVPQSIVLTDIGGEWLCRNNAATTAEVYVEMIVVCAVVVGCQDERKHPLLPHLASDFVEEFGFGAFEARRPTSHALFGIEPSCAVVPVFDEAVEFPFAVEETANVDRSTIAVIAEVSTIAAIRTNASALIGSDMLCFGNATAFEVAAQFGDSECELATHEHIVPFAGR